MRKTDRYLHLLNPVAIPTTCCFDQTAGEGVTGEDNDENAEQENTAEERATYAEKDRDAGVEKGQEQAKVNIVYPFRVNEILSGEWQPFG